MKATLESTEQLVTVNGVPARVWVGTSEHGIPFQALITRVAVDQALGLDAHAQLEEELHETHAPAPERPAFSTRMVL